MPRLDRLATLAERTGLGALARRRGLWHGTLVLTYHRIGTAVPGAGDPSVFSATPDDLAAQLDLVVRHAEVVAMEDVLADPFPTRPGRRVLITFDDGYRDNWSAALPVLQAARVPAAFFLATGFLDAPRSAWWDEIAWMARRPEGDDALHEEIARYRTLGPEATEPFLDALAERTGAGRRPRQLAADEWMTWDMARELVAAGMHVGGHTHRHPILARLDVDAQREEVERCRERLAAELGIEMRTFAYPVGLPDTFDERTRGVMAAAGVELAFAFSGGFVRRAEAGDPLAYPRTSVAASMSHARFAATITSPQLYARW